MRNEWFHKRLSSLTFLKWGSLFFLGLVRKISNGFMPRIML
uniref:Uncharacterized protein n=1 Tax=Pseudomonas syringae TaxID=317 RepID=I3W0D9_PSESX|nr:hypothetical protein [Pseudomonas syringae]